MKHTSFPFLSHVVPYLPSIKRCGTPPAYKASVWAKGCLCCLEECALPRGLQPVPRPEYFAPEACEGLQLAIQSYLDCIFRSILKVRTCSQILSRSSRRSPAPDSFPQQGTLLSLHCRRLSGQTTGVESQQHKGQVRCHFLGKCATVDKRMSKLGRSIRRWAVNDEPVHVHAMPSKMHVAVCRFAIFGYSTLVTR